MVDTSAYLLGELTSWPKLASMAAILRRAGLRIHVGRYSLRVEDCAHFVFQEYGGDLGDPTIEADADSVEQMLHDGQRVSAALVQAGVSHHFEVYDHRDELVGELSYDWPSER